MKKILLSACAILVASATFAQSKMAELPKELPIKFLANDVPVHYVPSSTVAASAPAPFWFNEFDNSADWTTYDAINGGLQDWVIGTAAPTGSFSMPMGAIASTTTANGFAMFDSDALGTSAANTQDATITYNGTVDCSTYSYVNINFESSHRMFHDSVFVEVSNDGWITFERYQVHADQAVNDQSDNPEFVSVNISSVAGNQAAVSFRFHYEGEWDYAWMVDDVTFSETPDNLITTSQEAMGGWWVAYQTVGGLGQDYTFYPLSQIAANPYSFESVITNQGIATQNVTMYVDVTEDASATSAFSSSSNPIQLTASQQDTFVANSTFSPTNTGLYTIEMWGDGDSAMTAVTTKSTIVTDYVYGKDLNSATGSWRLSRTVGNSATTVPGAFEIGPDFDMYADEQLYSIDAHLSDYSVPGAKIYVTLYEIDPTGSTDPIPLAVSDDYSITAADVDSWVSIPFLSPQSLFAGTEYCITIGGYLTLIDSAGISVSGSGDFSVDRMFDKDDHYQATTPGATWYTIGDIPMLRMNFDPSSGVSAVSDFKQSIFNIYPNPTNGVFIVELGEVAKYDVTVNNLLGQTVYTTSINHMKTTIDLSGFDKGVYTVELKNNLSTVTEKIIIE